MEIFSQFEDFFTTLADSNPFEALDRLVENNPALLLIFISLLIIGLLIYTPEG